MSNQYLDLINKEVQTSGINMNEAGTGGSARQVLETGQYLGAIVGYIDLGDQPEEFQGKFNGVFPCVRLEVAVFPPQEDGTLSTDPVIVAEREMFFKNNERATSFRAFKALNYQNDPQFRHFAQAFMRPYLFTITKRIAKQSQNPYNIIDWPKTVPAVDPMTRKPYSLPEIDDKFKVVFLWNNPVKEMWDKLHIEGTFDDGKSKNFIQETIINAKNFHGSAVDLMLRNGGEPLPEPQASTPKPEEPQPEPAAPVAPPAPVAPSMPASPEAS